MIFHFDQKFHWVHPGEFDSSLGQIYKEKGGWKEQEEEEEE